jgi:hypothetical protein
MRLRLSAAICALLLACTTPASAATIFTFDLSDGTGATPGSILSFSFAPLGAGGTLTVDKELDTFSPTVFAAVALGTTYAGATFAAYDGTVSPASRLFEYALTNAIFTSAQVSGGGLEPLETFSIFGETVTVTRGPAAAPEPATLLLIGTGAALMMRRRRVAVAPR